MATTTTPTPGERPATGSPLVTLTSDFGTGSPYVAAMKGVVLHYAEVRFIDISHSIPPFDVRGGAFVLWAGTRHLPRGGIHVAVVDPGVGTARRRLALSSVEGTWLGPDNGLLELVWRRLDRSSRAAWELIDQGEAAATFEGRDQFAIVAGRLAAGAPLEGVARRVDDLPDEPAQGPGVQWVDNFGNLVTDLEVRVPGLVVNGHEVRAHAPTYAEAPFGLPFWYVGSMGFIEIGLREGRADEFLGATTGTPVELLGPP